MNFIIEANNLRKTFGELVAVDDISFNVTHGECFGILGPNGAGKTSTIRMIYGFSPMSGGKLRIFALDIAQALREIKSRIGVCQQENSLDPDLTVLQNLMVFARYFDISPKAAAEKAKKQLKFFALDHRKDAMVTELSGGMMRRLVIARALINDPELLILDEPTTGLDPQSRHQVWERLELLKKSGLSILITTHYMDEASRLCDRLIIVDHGHILVEGKPQELIRKHVGHNIIEIDDPCTELKEYVRAHFQSYEATEHRLIIYDAESEAAFHTISTRFCEGGCILRPATLEDVFLRLTGRDLRE
jgi:lipooligosaccharide transport system ATP-binding protein